MSEDPTWSQKHAKRMVVVILSAGVSLWLLLLLPFDEPWNWLLVGLFLVLGAAFIGLLASFFLQQRDDYWHEQERDS
ncbi:hypothetical protein [Arthrobacter sp. zg-Y769]|uniref:hypothetical protein n=1 Tax=Arthrobacter sp. zg-Y769 TaxID=2894191 RepID=UPI001E48CC09|nr:hypothetical protein [Arthrobacter sp. zg-Y769]MCC9205100.1 hypothetical protein [Arthrobacter sp. zg-Y769]